MAGRHRGRYDNEESWKIARGGVLTGTTGRPSDDQLGATLCRDSMNKTGRASLVNEFEAERGSIDGHHPEIQESAPAIQGGRTQRRVR